MFIDREQWEEYGGRQEMLGLGEAVWRSEDPFSFHRLVTHDGVEKEAAELMMQAHVVVFFLRLLKATGYLEPRDGEERRFSQWYLRLNSNKNHLKRG